MHTTKDGTGIARDLEDGAEEVRAFFKYGLRKCSLQCLRRMGSLQEIQPLVVVETSADSSIGMCGLSPAYLLQLMYFC